MPVGDITIPGLHDLEFDIPSLSAQNATAAPAPLTVQVSSVAAEGIAIQQATAPAAGFTLTGLSLASASAADVSVPAVSAEKATVQRVHAAPALVPEVALNQLTLPAIQIPSLISTTPFDIPASLQQRSVGFDAGILSVALRVKPSTTSHVHRMNVTAATATGTVASVVARNVTLPFELTDLTLSQVGINSIAIPGLRLSLRGSTMSEEGDPESVVVPVARHDVNLTLDDILAPLTVVGGGRPAAQVPGGAVDPVEQRVQEASDSCPTAPGRRTRGEPIGPLGASPHPAVDPSADD